MRGLLNDFRCPQRVYKISCMPKGKGATDVLATSHIVFVIKLTQSRVDNKDKMTRSSDRWQWVIVGVSVMQVGASA